MRFGLGISRFMADFIRKVVIYVDRDVKRKDRQGAVLADCLL